MSSKHRYILTATVSLLCAVLLVAPAVARDEGVAEVALADGAVNDETVDSGTALGGRDIQETIWFQGFLADVNTGDPINGTVDVVARIYDAASGGASLWGPETHNTLTVTEGWFHIELGSVATLPAFDDPPYYLELDVDGETMDARQKLASVPMAYHAADLEIPFQGAITTTVTGFRVDSTNASNSNSAIFGGHVGTGPAVRGYHIGSGPAIMGDANGTGLAGLFYGDVDVNGDLETDTFKLTTTPSTGHVLTSDASGNGTWQAAGGGLTLPYFGSFLGESDAFAVNQAGANPYEAAEFRITNGASTGEAINATNMGTGDVIRGYHAGPTGGNVADFDIGNGGNSSPVIDARTLGEGPAYYGESAGLSAVVVSSSYASSNTHVIHAEYTGTTSDAVAVYGYSVPTDYYGIGGDFRGGYIGVRGRVYPTGSNTYYGVSGSASGGDGENRGVYGVANGTGTNYGVYGAAIGDWINTGVYGTASGGAANVAGQFDGNVNIFGILYKDAGAFKIDHPLDPANKYLCHSFVESPDMMNIYNGNVVLDARGEASVELPEWFDALNRDFRYQLTCIGAFAPVYVAEKISGNRFRIAGGEPGMEISWLVTGIRQDRFAEENRIPVEVEKPEWERGKYRHPEAHGLPETMGIGYAEHQEQRKLRREDASSRTSRLADEQTGSDDN